MVPEICRTRERRCSHQVGVRSYIPPSRPLTWLKKRICYEYGDGVAKDHEEAVAWYALSLQYGEGEAKTALRRLLRLQRIP